MFQETVTHKNPIGTVIALHGFGQVPTGAWIKYLDFDRMSGLSNFCRSAGLNLVYVKAPKRCWYSLRSWGSVLKIAREIRSYANYHGVPGNTMIAGFSDGACMAQVCYITYPSLWERAIFHSGTFVDMHMPIFPDPITDTKIVVAVGNEDWLPPFGMNNVAHAEKISKHYSLSGADVRRYFVDDYGHEWIRSYNEQFFIK